MCGHYLKCTLNDLYFTQTLACCFNQKISLIVDQFAEYNFVFLLLSCCPKGEDSELMFD